MSLKHYILMSKIFFLSSILSLCTACSYREPNYCQMVDCITKNYLEECAKPRDLVLTGYGGATMNDIQNVTLSFLSFDALNVDEARILYVEMMEEFLKRMNCHESIRPHLHNFPFEESNIKLKISFKGPDITIRGDGHVALMYYIGRHQDLFYRGYNPETEEFYALHREPYEEALRVVKGRSNCDFD